MLFAWKLKYSIVPACYKLLTFGAIQFSLLYKGSLPFKKRNIYTLKTRQLELPLPSIPFLNKDERAAQIRSIMRNFTMYLMMMAVTIVMAPVVTDGQAELPAKRSRFLAASMPIYDCSKKSSDVCLAPRSPGPTCCSSRCVDTVSSADHCGGCNKVCNHGWTCCGGRCVNLSSDKDNCGRCSNQCSKKCSYGFCDYA